ncbi:MAG: hypothetical protein L3K01_03930 [Thermoplasmata archaeon]|nr:hypothetical protein [Thermoplasmata archaeon]
MRASVGRFVLTPNRTPHLVRLLSLAALAALLLLPTSVATASPASHAGRPSPAAEVSPKALGTPPGAAPSTQCGAGTPATTCAAALAAPFPPAGGRGINPSAWTDISTIAGGPPPARYLGSMVWDPVDNYLLMFGGYDAGVKTDTWEFSHNQWTEVGSSGPSGRYVASLAWDYTDGYAVLFGGYNASATYYADTWTYVGGVWTDVTGNTNQTPTGRWRAAMSWDSGDGYVVMFGGTNSAGTVLSDTWKFLHGNWTLLTVSGSPTGRYRASMVDDPLDNETVLFGGCTAATCADSSTWAYHNLTWTNLAPTTHPSARVYYGMTYSTISKTVLLFGGTTSGTLNTPVADTWNFTNGTWTSLTTAIHGAPTAIAYTMMAFDPLDGYTVLYGGEWSNNTFSDQTWALGPSILGQLSVSPSTIDLGQSTKVNATPFAFSNYVSYNYTALPAGCAAGNVSNFTCTPTATGTFQLDASLNDSVGTPALENGTLNVAADPTISSSAWDLSTVTNGTATTLRTIASGGSGALSYRYTNLPNGCVSTSVANLSCTPKQSGTFAVHVAVTDVARFTVGLNVTLVVNGFPAFGSLLAFPAAIDQGQSFTVYANISSGTGTAPFTYVYHGLPVPCPSSNTSTLVCMPSSTGSSVVTVNVTDRFGWSVASGVGVTVNADPTIAAGVASPSAFDVGTPFTLWANATGGTGAITYNYSGTPTGCNLGNHPANTCTPTVAGNFTITVNATDASGFRLTETVGVVVNPALNLGPISVTPSTIDVGQSVTIRAIPTGGTGPFSFVFSGLPGSCPQTPGTGNVTCSPSVAGPYTLTVAVTDASGVSAPSGGSLQVNVDPGVISFLPSANPITIGQSFDLTVVAGNGSHPYSYAYNGLPPGCASTNSSTIHCTPTATGSYTPGVTVKDSLGFPTTAQTYLNVTAVASSTFLGLPALAGYALIGLVVVVVAAVAYLALRRRSAAPKAPPEEKPDQWSEESNET